MCPNRQRVCLDCRKFWSSTPSTVGVGRASDAEVQGHPQSSGEFEASLDHTRPRLKKNKGRKREGKTKERERRRKKRGRKERNQEREGGRRKGERTMFYPCPTRPCLINLYSYNVSFCSWHTVCTQAATQDPDQKPELQASLGDHERVLNFALAQPSL